MNVTNWLFVLFFLAFINGIIGASGVRRFLSAHPVINSPQDIESFKQMVRVQMYQALIQTGLLVIVNIIGVYGLITHRTNLLIVLLLNGVILFMGKSMKGAEERARSMEVANAGLAAEYEHICKTWIEKALPDF